MLEEKEERWARLVAARLGPGADDFMETLDRFEASHPHGEPH